MPEGCVRVSQTQNQAVRLSLEYCSSGLLSQFSGNSQLEKLDGISEISAWRHCWQDRGNKLWVCFPKEKSTFKLTGQEPHKPSLGVHTAAPFRFTPWAQAGRPSQELQPFRKINPKTGSQWHQPASLLAETHLLFSLERQCEAASISKIFAQTQLLTHK